VNNDRLTPKICYLCRFCNWRCGYC